MKEFLWRSVVSAAAVWLADVMVTGIKVTELTVWWQQILAYLIVGAVLAIVQLVIKPFVTALTFVLYLLTLGLFGVVVSALMLMLVGWVTGHFSWGITVDGFWPSVVLGGIIISIATSILTAVLPKPRRNNAR